MNIVLIKVHEKSDTFTPGPEKNFNMYMVLLKVRVYKNFSIIIRRYKAKATRFKNREYQKNAAKRRKIKNFDSNLS